MAETVSRTYEIVYRVKKPYNIPYSEPDRFEDVDEALALAREYLTNGDKWATVEVSRDEHEVSSG